MTSTQLQTNPLRSWKTYARVLIALVAAPAILFPLAGRLDWWQAWLMFGLYMGGAIVTRLVIARKNPDLILERARFGEFENTKAWDKKLVGLIQAGPYLIWIVAGLDERFGWSPEFPLAATLAAFGVACLGYGLTCWAMLVNRFFSAMVRIQTERGHRVVSSGPYHFVRHPGYSGAILALLVSPVLLGSLWAILPTLLVLPIYILRTALEDRTLQAELPGYAGYARRTPFRLLPGVW